MTLLSTQFGRIRDYFDASQSALFHNNVWRSCIHVSMHEVIGGRSRSRSVGLTRRGQQICNAFKSGIARHGGETARVSELQFRGFFRSEVDAYHCARSIQAMSHDGRSQVPHHYIEATMGLSSGVCLRKSEANIADYYGFCVGFASWLTAMDTTAEICVSSTFFNRLGKVAPNLQQDFVPSSIAVKGYVNAEMLFRYRCCGL